MKRYLLLLVILSLYSCGGGGGGGGGLPPTNEPNPPVTGPPETQAAVIHEARLIAEGTNSIFSKIGNIGLNIIGVPPVPVNISADSFQSNSALRKLDKRIKGLNIRNAVPGVVTDCTSGGTYIYTFDGSSTYNITFSDCKENDLQVTGTYGIVAAGSDYAITLGSGSTPFKILDFDGDFLVAALDATLTLNVSRSGDSTNGTSNVTANGIISSRDFLSITAYAMSFTNFSTFYTYSPGTKNITVNGGYNESSAGLSDVSFSNFVLNISEAPPISDYSVNGAVTFDFFPTARCFRGTFNIVTEVPIRYDSTLDHATQGRLVVNGSTIIEWNADGTVTVTISEIGPVTYADEAEMMQVCYFCNPPDSDAPPIVGLTGTTTGDTMTVTLLWLGGTTSDMDLHVNYYNVTAPTATTTGTWYVDWHTGKTCTGGGAFFANASDAIDSNGDGICDTGLDIDDVEGYGPEHITAATLPTGYYVVSVNSYALDTDPSASVLLTIKIGDSIFGQYTSTLTTADAEGTDPNSWFRVADIRANSDGTVDVMAPDLSLEPWHDGNFGMAPTRLLNKVKIK